MCLCVLHVADPSELLHLLYPLLASFHRLFSLQIITKNELRWVLGWELMKLNINTSNWQHGTLRYKRQMESTSNTGQSFFPINVYSQVTFTWTVGFSSLPKLLYAVKVNSTSSVLLMFVIVSTFPSCTTTVFPWFTVSLWSKCCWFWSTQSFAGWLQVSAFKNSWFTSNSSDIC